MHVALITRATLFTVAGGDTIQVTHTAKHLRQLGIIADIKLTDEVIEYDKYDLLHFFNIIRPADILCHVERSGKPYVVSTILVDYSEYDKNHRQGTEGLLFRTISSDKIEYVKTVARYIKGNDKLMTQSYLWKGQKKCAAEIIERASMLFPNSFLEQDSLRQHFGFSTDCMIVPNGIDPELFQLDKTVKKTGSLVLCVGRIEGIKNQLNLIRALNHTRYRLLIIGSPAPNQLTYYRQCRETAATNIGFIEQLPQHKLVEYYQMAQVHVLPSWFESCGLSSLEAAAMGCNIVVTGKGYTREYYEDYAFYCDPGSPGSIFNAVESAAAAEFPVMLREKILSNYTWNHAAARIANAYHHLPIYT